MSRLQKWHSTLLPALFFSLLLHTALLPIWKQSSHTLNPDLPTLQLTLRATTDVRTTHSQIKKFTSAKSSEVTAYKPPVPKFRDKIDKLQINANSTAATSPVVTDLTHPYQGRQLRRQHSRQRSRSQTRPSQESMAKNEIQQRPMKIAVSQSSKKHQNSEAVVLPDLRPAPIPSKSIKKPSQHSIKKMKLRIQATAIVNNNLFSKPGFSIILRSPAHTEKQPATKLVRSFSAPTPARMEKKPRQSAHTQPTASPAIAKSRVLAWLNHEIKKYFYYPGTARRRNLEGTVILRFQVKQTGQITNTSVAQSSGAGILDRAALASLHKLGIVTLPLGENLDLKLPIIYRLDQSG